jgi:hypothetical protein
MAFPPLFTGFFGILATCGKLCRGASNAAESSE